MKRKYVTPVITAEYYSLTQSIAGCATKIGFSNRECVLNDPDSTAGMKDFAMEGYFADVNGCTELASAMDGYDIICYHTNAQAAFNS